MKKSVISVLLLITVVAGIAGWTMYRNKERSVPVCTDCNVVLIVIDPLRYDAVHALGNPKPVTPYLDGLVNTGIVFTEAVAASSWTLPSAMSLMTGVYPSGHGIINKELLGKSKDDPTVPASLPRTAPGLVTLARVMKTYGYRTAGFAGGAALDGSYGFDQGFESYTSPGDFGDSAGPIESALGFAGVHTGEKLFVFVHGFDVHGQYTPSQGLDRRFVSPAYRGKLNGSEEEQKAIREEGVLQGRALLTPEDAEFLRALYDEKVQRMDERIGRFIESWKSLGLVKKTVFIVTSNHGDEFYEHGRIDHGMTLFDEVIHVPLIMTVPGTSPVRISQQVRTIDIAPTVLDLVGIRPEKAFSETIPGKNLVPLMSGQNVSLDAYSESSYRYATFLQSIRTADGWKLIRDMEKGTTMLFNIGESPDETRDLSGGQKQRVKKLQDALSEFSGP